MCKRFGDQQPTSSRKSWFSKQTASNFYLYTKEKRFQHFLPQKKSFELWCSYCTTSFIKFSRVSSFTKIVFFSLPRVHKVYQKLSTFLTHVVVFAFYYVFSANLTLLGNFYLYFLCFQFFHIFSKI